MLSSIPRIYPLLGLLGGYLVVLFFNPIRLALRDGLRCILRFKRIWLTFVLLGFAYSVFDFATSASLRGPVEFDLNQITAPGSWEWPSFFDVWSAVPLRMLEGVAGIFDNATTTYPLSVVAAVLLLINWRGLHGALMRALAKRYGAWGYLIYLVVIISALATLCKPIIFWKLGAWMSGPGAASWLKRSAIVIPTAEIFEYFFGVYIQVYLIAVCLAWIKGLSFGEDQLFRFAMRRFTYVLEWAGVVAIVSTLVIRAPLLAGFFGDAPNVFDYARFFMSGFIIIFGSVQVSLVLHNETLRAALQAHKEFIRTNLFRFGWFLLIAALHYFFLITSDAIVLGAVADRPVGVIAWKIIFVCLRGLITGWLLASWVCLFRQCETRRANQEKWIQAEIQY
jgi:hypothetical protein